MLVDNLTKLYYKKKEWITPKHPLYLESESFKIHYAAAVIMQARLNQKMELRENFELQRLLKRGLELTTDQVKDALSLSRESAEVMDYLYTQTTPGSKRYFLMLDLYNVCMRDEEMSRQELEFIQLFARMLDIPEQYLPIFRQFMEAAYEEREAACRSIYHQMEQENMGISLMELKYYLMTLYDTMTCTQKMIEQQKEIRIVDRCVIEEDLVLKPGMRLVFDHAIVRIYGNIALQGGELIVEDSWIIRKSDSHRACINIHSDGIVKVIRSEVDCRNQGMFIRAQDGQILLQDSEIYQTTRGAAVRFWGKRLEVVNCYFHHCYSPEAGGAIMMRGGKARIAGCRFRHCEARKGGAIYGLEPMEVTESTFEKCYVSEYGAAVYYVGMIGDKMKGLTYQECFPEGAETIQYIAGHGSMDIESEYEIAISTIFDCPVEVLPQGYLRIRDSVLYLSHPIRCRGQLEMERVSVFCREMEQRDMLVLEHGKQCLIRECRMDGMGEHGGIFVANTRLEIEHSYFCNMQGGRTVFNATSPKITGCTFNFCQNGGVHCQGGTIRRCQFVNCRGKSGAGVTMLGKQGMIAECQFIRCVSDISGGAVDRGIGNQVIQCEFFECNE